MKLIRYLGSHLLESLENSELKVAKVTDFNDPFEFRYKHTGNFGRTQAKRMLRSRIKSPVFWRRVRCDPRFSGLSKKQIKKGFRKQNRGRILDSVSVSAPQGHQDLIESAPTRANESTRILCFSRPTENRHWDLLRWGHYSDCQKGARIWIDLSFQSHPLCIPYPMNYTDDLVSMDNRLIHRKGYFDEKVRESMVTKSTCWQYEDEIRVFVPRPFFSSRNIAGDELDFVPINLKGIYRIDFGIRFPETTRRRIVQKFKNLLSEKIEFFQAKCHQQEYQIVYEPI